jgi:hypothetical protein
MNRHVGVSVYGTSYSFDPAVSCHRDENGTHAIRILARREKAHNSELHASVGHRRSPWRSLTRALALAAAIGSAAVPDTGHAQAVPTPPTPPTFTKQAFDANTELPLTGPPVSVGQTIEYVLSYKPGTAPTGPVTIDDTLSSALAYVGPILAPPGWTWTLPPYSVGNHEVYSNSGFGPGTSFIVNVPVSQLAQVGQTGGDGTLPIPVGNRVYGIYHHQPKGSGNIYCWELLPLTKCPDPGGANPWPRSIGSDLMTPTLLRHAVVGTRIYFPSARVVGSGATATATPGIGCWDTGNEAPCAISAFIPLTGFIPLPVTPAWPAPVPPAVGGAPSGLDPLVAGIAADPNGARLFMYAADTTTAPSTGRVYCVPLSAGACPWGTSPTLGPGLPGISKDSFGDMILEETSGGSATRLYVGHSGLVTCLELTNGGPCFGDGNWIGFPPASEIKGAVLTPVLDNQGQMTHVCIINANQVTVPECFTVGLGGPSTGTGWGILGAPSVAFGAAMNSLPTNSFGISAFRVPGKARVLYPGGVYGKTTTPVCFDFGADAVCATPPFAPAFSTVTSGLSDLADYGYAVDPAAPDRCLLGLGDKGKVWRFTRDGGFGANGCVNRVEATFDINSFFPCVIKPKQATWDSIVIKKRPQLPGGLLTGGTISLVNSSGSPIIPPITVGAANTYPVNIPAMGANAQVTILFTPTYSGTPATGYQLELTFTADVDPYICYQAVVKDCGPVRNDASMVGSLVGRPPVPFKANASVNLGNATGRICEPGILKVCKVAGPGITVGETFHFMAISKPFTVPAGPPPGGTCVVVGQNYPVPSGVIVKEQIPPGVTVSSIAVEVAPPGQVVSTNLADGSVNLLIGSGVTEVTFTDKRTGFLEICKSGEVKGNSKFTVSGLGPFDVPPGACSPAIELPAGEVVIHETPPSGTAMAGCNTIPPSQQGPCDPKAQTSTVTVAAGNVSSMTIAFITNKYTKGGAGPAPPK